MEDNKVTVTCSLLGESFTLSCPKEDEADLRGAIALFKDLLAKLLLASPNLTPQQAAILTALKALSQKKEIERGSSPFLAEVEKKLSELEAVMDKDLPC